MVKRRVLKAGRILRDLRVVYVAAFLLVALVAELVPVLRTTGLAASATVLLFAGRAMTNGLHNRSCLGLTVVGAGWLTAIGLYLLAAWRMSEADAPMFTVGALVILYAWGVVFYRRRVLTPQDLQRIATLLRERLAESGDSSEAGQEIQDVLTRLGEQQRAWSGW